MPPRVMTNEDWSGLVETSDEWITTKTGIKERRIADPETCTSDLAVLASQQAIEEAGLSPDDIDMLILATSSPDVPLSSTAGSRSTSWVAPSQPHSTSMRSAQVGSMPLTSARGTPALPATTTSWW